jgi:hypothetical protein
MPQIAYYFWAYASLLAEGALALGDPVRFVVPTGNFGNILAGWYAKEMGLPVSRLVCASNRNNVLTDFIETGVYDRNRGFSTTMSPSMDILVSSNLERLLFELAGRDAGTVAGWMGELSERGRYDIGAARRDRLAALFTGGAPGTDGGGSAGGGSAGGGSAPRPADDYAYLERLEKLTGVPAPAPLRGLRDKPRLHFAVTGKDPSSMKEAAITLLFGDGRM